VLQAHWSNTAACCERNGGVSVGEERRRDGSGVLV
jgi:hypothetical protein